jgi:histidine triad (HIT) family protein
MVGCEFCAIVAGDRGAHVVHDGEHALAILDETPTREGHTVVLPKSHHEELLGTEEAGKEVFRVVDTVAAGLREVLQPDGFSVFYTSGPMVGSVRHAHVHVVPREEGDRISLALDRSALDHDAAADLAERVRAVDA